MADVRQAELNEIQHQIRLKQLYRTAQQSPESTPVNSTSSSYKPSSTRLRAMQEVSKKRNKYIRQYNDESEIKRLHDQTARITGDMNEQLDQATKKYKSLAYFNSQLKQQEQAHWRYEQQINSTNKEKWLFRD